MTVKDDLWLEGEELHEEPDDKKFWIVQNNNRGTEAQCVHPSSYLHPDAAKRVRTGRPQSVMRAAIYLLRQLPFRDVIDDEASANQDAYLPFEDPGIIWIVNDSEMADMLTTIRLTVNVGGAHVNPPDHVATYLLTDAVWHDIIRNEFGILIRGYVLGVVPKRVVLLVWNDFDGDSRVQRTAQVSMSFGHEVFVLAKASKRYPPSSEPRIINGIKVLHVDESSLNAPSRVEVAKEISSLLVEASKLRVQDLMGSVTRFRMRVGLGR